MEGTRKGNIMNEDENSNRDNDEGMESRGSVLCPSDIPVSVKKSTSTMCSGMKCNVCGIHKNDTSLMYCPECLQKLCHDCKVIHDQLGATRNHYSNIEICWPESQSMINVAPTTDGDNESKLKTFASKIRNDLGIQVCVEYDDGVIELLAPTRVILDIALSTVQLMEQPSKFNKDTMVTIKDRGVECTIRGHLAIIVVKLFQEELKQLAEKFAVQIKVRHEKENGPSCDSNDEKSKGTASKLDNMEIGENRDMELQVRSRFGGFEMLKSNMEDILNAVKNLPKAEILRPRQDEFRMRIYAMMKDVDNDVVCFVVSLESVFKLVIKAREEQVVEDVRQEFLSLFCKECSSCHEESPRPTYLECKHVLCQSCVTLSACYNDGLNCPVCKDQLRQKTPLLSLQLKCIQVIDQMTKKSPVSNDQINAQQNKTRRKNHVTKPQTSIAIPRYLLNKWKKSSGGIQRLKSLIERKYGLHVSGSDDNLKIYGQQYEILELAIQTLESMNTNSSLNTQALETGISSRIVDGNVEWRLRGEFARIIHFLFNKDLYDLKRKFHTVTIQAFTEIVPSIVDIQCGYSEYMKVKYEMEELENDLKKMYTDECIQPRNFFFNEKVRDFVQSKHRDEKVHCTNVEKNNLNVVTFRGRKKDYVQSAKDQLLRWS